MISYLWEDRDEGQGRSSLRQALWNLRKALEPNSDTVILTSGDNLALTKEAVEVDVDHFEELLAAGSLEDLEQASLCYQGKLLDGFVARGSLLDDHINFERERLKTAAVKALTTLVGSQHINGAIDAAIDSANRIISIDPLSEDAHRALMGLYSEQGKKAQALKQYVKIRELLRSELDVEPSPETETLHQSIKASQILINQRNDNVLSAPTSLPVGSKHWHRWHFVTVTIAIVTILALVRLWYFGPPDLLPGKISIAVLPFTNMSGDPDQEYFTDGMTEDLTTDLSKISSLFVISRNSAFTYKGKVFATKNVASELGVRYILEGSMRRVGDQVRINTQLIDASTDSHLWAERYDGPVADIFAFQDQVIRKIVTALAINLTPEEEELQNLAQTDNPEAYDAFLQGWSHYLQNTRSNMGKALGFFERAIELDPEYSRAHAALAGSYISIMDLGWQYRLHRCLAKPLAEKHLRLSMKQPNALAHRFTALLRVGQGKHEEAITEAERAIVLDPNDSENYTALGSVLVAVGRASEAIEAYEKAMQLNPHYTASYQQQLGYAYFGSSQYEMAATHIERARNRNPELEPWVLMAAYGYLGRKEKAAAVKKEFYKIRGWLDFEHRDIDHIIASWNYQHRADAKRLAIGLIKAGLCCENKLQSTLDKLRPDSAMFREVEFPESFDLPKGVTVMTEADLLVKLVDNTMIGKYDGDRDPMHFHADGTLTGLFHNLLWCNYWAVSGPVLCIGIDSQRYCETLELDGSVIKPFKLDGTPKPLRELAQGNALEQ